MEMCICVLDGCMAELHWRARQQGALVEKMRHKHLCRCMPPGLHNTGAALWAQEAQGQYCGHRNQGQYCGHRNQGQYCAHRKQGQYCAHRKLRVCWIALCEVGPGQRSIIKAVDIEEDEELPEEHGGQGSQQGPEDSQQGSKPEAAAEALEEPALHELSAEQEEHLRMHSSLFPHEIVEYTQRYHALRGGKPAVTRDMLLALYSTLPATAEETTGSTSEGHRVRARVTSGSFGGLCTVQHARAICTVLALPGSTGILNAS